MSAICAKPSKGKGVIHKRVKTAGVYPLAPAAGRGNSPLRFSENPPPVRGEHACGSSCTPLSRC